MEMIQTFHVKTSGKSDLIDITHFIREAIKKSGVGEGLCYIFIPHTTAAVTINENADPSVAEDISTELNKIVPVQSRYRHLEGNSPGHIKSSLVGCCQTVLVQSGEPLLGTWQGVFLCEFDGPRTRKIHVKVIRG